MKRYTEKLSELGYATNGNLINELKIDSDNQDIKYIAESQKEIIIKLVEKLGPLEDLMENHGIESVEELEKNLQQN
jgi:hypothetical protein